MTALRLALLLPLLIAAAGCDRAQTKQRQGAAGQILPGSISDTMIQTERVQIEPPLADPTPESASPATEAEGAKAKRGAAKAASKPKPTPKRAESSPAPKAATSDTAPSPAP